MRMISLMMMVGVVFISYPAFGGDKATPTDVHSLVVNAYEVIKVLKDEALPAFNDPKGEFVYKDTYVFVLKCPEYVVAHPYALDKLKDRDVRRDYPFQIDFCEGGNDPQGAWVEYHWPKPGSDEPSRKISFCIHVDGTPYTVVAGIYNDDMSIEELNKKFKKQ